MIMTSTELTASGWTRFWNRGRWWKALIVVVVYLALYELAGLGIGKLFGNNVDVDDVLATPESVFFGIVTGLIVGSVILLIFVASVRWFGPIFERQPVRGRGWMWIAVVLTLIPILLRLFGINYEGYPNGVVAVTGLVGIFVGFSEELLYRGIVVRILREGGHREWTVAVISSLFFALSHSVNLLSGQSIIVVGGTVVFTFGFGMMMYLVMRVTGSIVWPMIIHGFTDPTTLLASGGLDAIGTNGSSGALLTIAGGFSLIFVVAALIAMIFIRGNSKSTTSTPAGVEHPGAATTQSTTL
jgi:membrane protease YdiL (CAAX protease family)